MTVAYWCVLLAALLPYVFTGLAKSRSDFNNARPRVWLADLAGWRQRAHWAQLNAFEAFPAFAAGVIIAQLAGAEQAVVNGLALVFIAARVVHGVVYIADRPSVRSVAFLVGLGCVVGLFVAAAASGG